MRRVRWLLAALALASLAQPAAGEEKWMEGAGVARAEPGEGKTGPGRQAALQAALAEAVQNVAVELLIAAETQPGKPPPDPSALRERAVKALGGDPSAFVSRYQIREDRGVQPRLLLPDPEAKAEYQLVVVAQVDVAKVRQRVGARAPAPPAEAAAAKPAADPAASRPATTPAPAKPGGEIAAATPGTAPAPPPAEVLPEGGMASYDVEIDQLTSYKEYAAIREALLGKVGASRAAPVEFSRGRAVLSVEAPVVASQLPAVLSKALGGSVVVDPVPAPPGVAAEPRVRLRVRAAPLPLPPPGRLTP